jgi:hypothetical protein
LQQRNKRNISYEKAATEEGYKNNIRNNSRNVKTHQLQNLSDHLYSSGDGDAVDGNEAA